MSNFNFVYDHLGYLMPQKQTGTPVTENLQDEIVKPVDDGVGPVDSEYVIDGYVPDEVEVAQEITVLEGLINKADEVGLMSSYCIEHLSNENPSRHQMAKYAKSAIVTEHLTGVMVLEDSKDNAFMKVLKAIWAAITWPFRKLGEMLKKFWNWAFSKNKEVKKKSEETAKASEAADKQVQESVAAIVADIGDKGGVPLEDLIDEHIAKLDETRKKEQAEAIQAKVAAHNAHLQKQIEQSEAEIARLQENNRKLLEEEAKLAEFAYSDPDDKVIPDTDEFKAFIESVKFITTVSDRVAYFLLGSKNKDQRTGGDMFGGNRVIRFDKGAWKSVIPGKLQSVNAIQTLESELSGYINHVVNKTKVLSIETITGSMSPDEYVGLLANSLPTEDYFKNTEKVGTNVGELRYHSKATSLGEALESQGVRIMVGYEGDYAADGLSIAIFRRPDLIQRWVDNRMGQFKGKSFDEEVINDPELGVKFRKEMVQFVELLNSDLTVSTQMADENKDNPGAIRSKLVMDYDFVRNNFARKHMEDKNLFFGVASVAEQIIENIKGSNISNIQKVVDEVIANADNIKKSSDIPLSQKIKAHFAGAFARMFIKYIDIYNKIMRVLTAWRENHLRFQIEVLRMQSHLATRLREVRGGIGKPDSEKTNGVMKYPVTRAHLFLIERELARFTYIQ